MGFVRAYDAKTGEFKWTVPEKFAVWGGTLATKGNLVFCGTLDGDQGARQPQR